MAILFASGFETGDGSEWASVIPSVVVQSSIKHTGNYAARVQNFGGITTTVAGLHRLSFWFYAAALPLEGDGWVSFVDNEGASTKVGAYINSSGQIKLRCSAGLSGYDESFTISTGRWYRICIAVNYIGTGWENNNRLYVDNRLVAWADDSLAYFSARRIGVPPLGPPTLDFYYDDVVYDGDTSLVNMEDVRVLRAGITGAGTHAEFDSYVGSAVHYENVDELSPSEDDYNYDSVNNPAKESYALETSSTIGLITRNVIKSVETLVRMKRGGGGGTIFNFLRRDNGVDIEDPVEGVSTSWLPFRHFDDEMPNGGGRWTQDRLDALEIGISYNGGARDPYFSFAVAMIVFSPFLFVRSDVAAIGGASANLTFVTTKKPSNVLNLGASGSGQNSWDF